MSNGDQAFLLEYIIRSISLWYCDISESAVPKCLSEMESLVFIGVKFNDKIFEYLPSLKRISIVRTDIDNIDFIKRYETLRDLCIIECDNISDFSAIYALDKLERFETDNINFAEKEIDELQSKLPKCKIKIKTCK